MTILDEQARKKAAKTRSKRAELVNCKTLQRRRRQPHEIAAVRVSVQNFCRECMGFESDDTGTLAEAVRRCTAVECWLYPWRNGKLDERA